MFTKFCQFWQILDQFLSYIFYVFLCVKIHIIPIFFIFDHFDVIFRASLLFSLFFSIDDNHLPFKRLNLWWPYWFFVPKCTKYQFWPIFAHFWLIFEHFWPNFENTVPFFFQFFLLMYFICHFILKLSSLWIYYW